MPSRHMVLRLLIYTALYHVVISYMRQLLRATCQVARYSNCYLKWWSEKLTISQEFRLESMTVAYYGFFMISMHILVIMSLLLSLNYK